METQDYNTHAYNQVLKVPLALLLVNFYLLKHYLFFALPIIANIPFIGAVTSPFVGLLPSQADSYYYYSDVLFMYSCIPALLVFISTLRRLPKTQSRIIRWIWHQGRILLLMTVILEILLFLGYALLKIRRIDETVLILFYIDFIVIIYLFTSQRVKKVFAEFPQAIVPPAFDEIQKLDESAWEQARQLDTEQAYQNYLETPISRKRHAYQARQRRDELREQARHVSSI